MKDNEQFVKVGELVQSNILKHELIILLAIIFLIAAKLFMVTFPEEILFLILSLIAVIYFFSAFAIPGGKTITGMDLFFHKFIGIASAITTMGILFTILKIPGYDLMILVGVGTLIIDLIYVIIKRTKNPETEIFSKMIIIRILVLALVSGGLLFYGVG